MTTVYPGKPVLLISAISASLATLAVEGSAQPRSAPESTLSDAVAEALQGPFHGDDAPRARRN